MTIVSPVTRQMSLNSLRLRVPFTPFTVTDKRRESCTINACGLAFNPLEKMNK